MGRRRMLPSPIFAVSIEVEIVSHKYPRKNLNIPGMESVIKSGVGSRRGANYS